jgi:hypothetical protein
MTELPTLQAALRETAERTYPRRRRPLVPALLVAAAAAAALMVMHDRDTQPPASEVAATPIATQPEPTVVFTPTPSATPDIPAPAKLQAAKRVSPDDPALQGLLGPGATVMRAWSVPEFKGHVILARSGTDWCLSMPDPVSTQPDIERGSTCQPDARFRSRGIKIGMGGNDVEVGLTHPGTAEATGPDGKTHTVKLHGGELVIAHGMIGAEYRLSQFEPGIK